MAWSKKRHSFNSNSAYNDSKSDIDFRCISANGFINVSLRVPKRIKKRKLGRATDGYSTGTVRGHYLSFVKATLDEMDTYPEMKGHYLVLYNAPIHNSADIGKYINLYIFLPILLSRIQLSSGQL